MSELKPCPFCGGPALSFRHRNSDRVSCADAGCRGYVLICTAGEWNMRAEAALATAREAALQADVERLTKERDDWKRSLSEWKTLALKHEDRADAATAREAALRDALAQARECITTLADELDSYTLEGSFRDDANATLATIDAVTADTRMEGGE